MYKSFICSVYVRVIWVHKILYSENRAEYVKGDRETLYSTGEFEWAGFPPSEFSKLSPQRHRYKVYADKQSLECGSRTHFAYMQI